jgi:hypothetical protein
MKESDFHCLFIVAEGKLFLNCWKTLFVNFLGSLESFSYIFPNEIFKGIKLRKRRKCIKKLLTDDGY